MATEPAATAKGRADELVLAALCAASFLAALNFYAATPFYSRMARDLATTVPLLGQVATLMILISAGLGLVGRAHVRVVTEHDVVDGDENPIEPHVPAIDERDVVRGRGRECEARQRRAFTGDRHRQVWRTFLMLVRRACCN